MHKVAFLLAYALYLISAGSPNEDTSPHPKKAPATSKSQPQGPFVYPEASPSASVLGGDGGDRKGEGQGDQSQPELDVCEQPQVIGPCRAAIPAWWFNPESRQCKEFTYGGCRGNKNRFDTEQKCIHACAKTTGSPDKVSSTTGGGGGEGKGEGQGDQSQPELDVCEQPQVIGPCRADFPAWWFDSESRQCEEFTYGGCRGNKNRFDTKQQCLDTCNTPPPAPTPSPLSEVDNVRHRDLRGPTSLRGVIERNATLPLLLGLLMVVALLTLLAVRCRVNVKRGPAQLRRMVQDDKPELFGPGSDPFLSPGAGDKAALVNGMYA